MYIYCYSLQVGIDLQGISEYLAADLMADLQVQYALSTNLVVFGSLLVVSFIGNHCDVQVLL